MEFKFNGDVILDEADQVILIKLADAGSFEEVVNFHFTQRRDLMKKTKREKDWSEDANRIFALFGFERFHKIVNPEFDIMDYCTNEATKEEWKRKKSKST